MWYDSPMQKTFREKYFGDRDFYQTVITIVLPLLIQQVVTSFVNMLDNIMVGRIGTLAMSGVSIANQLTAIFNLTVFGSIAGASIFGAQFYGKGDSNGQRNCLRFKLVIEMIVCTVIILLFLTHGEQLISIFLHSGTDTAADVQATLGYGTSYLRILCIGFIPFALSQSISSAIRETGETRLPMIASLAAIFTNLIGNTLLIFGYLGFPALGSDGAAIATVISRFAELAVLLFFVMKYKERFPFFHHLLSRFHIPASLAKDIIRRGFPLTLNEFLFSVGIAALAQCYSTRGIAAVAAYNISNTIESLFFVFNIAMGDCISIMVGQQLGSGKTDQAVDTDRKLITVTFLISMLLGIVLFLLAPVFPHIYNTSDEIRAMASSLLRICGLTLWISALYNASYFTLRCGGKTIITFLFDSVGMIAVSFPAAYVLSRFTSLDIIQIFLIIHLVDLYKVALGLFLVHKGVWINNLVDSHVNE